MAHVMKWQNFHFWSQVDPIEQIILEQTCNQSQEAMQAGLGHPKE